jgi:hypothetical protein
MSQPKNTDSNTAFVSFVIACMKLELLRWWSEFTEL